MKLWVLGSGSKGNAVVIESGECRIMIDAGFGPRALQRRLRVAGIAPESIEGCVITHEHSDHSRGALKAARRWGWPLFATRGTFTHSKLRQHVVTTFTAGATLSFSDFDVETFLTPHDAAEPIGVVVTSRTTGARSAVCTDIGHASRSVRSHMRDIDILVLESNHDETMLANGPYPPWLQARIRSNVGHLSNIACGALVRDSVSPRLRQIVLAHLSEHNNTPMLAFENMRAATKGTGFRGTLMTAFQESVVGPLVPGMTRRTEQLALPF